MYCLVLVRHHTLLRKKAPRRPKPSPAPRRSKILDQGRALADEALGKLLDAVEKDPEAVVAGAERALNSLGRIAAAAGDLRKWARENPEEAKAKIREAVVKGIQEAAKRRRTV